jgi:hypothetical protein
MLSLNRISHKLIVKNIMEAFLHGIKLFEAGLIIN